MTPNQIANYKQNICNILFYINMICSLVLGSKKLLKLKLQFMLIQTCLLAIFLVDGTKKELSLTKKVAIQYVRVVKVINFSRQQPFGLTLGSNFLRGGIQTFPYYIFGTLQPCSFIKFCLKCVFIEPCLFIRQVRV